MSERGVRRVRRVYPWPERTLYYRVLVFGSRAALRAYARQTTRRGPAFWAHATGYCYRYIVRRRGRVLPCCGEIVLNVRDLGLDVIAHECTHAAIGLLLTPLALPTARGASAAEEDFCAMVGTLTAQVVAAIANIERTVGNE